MVEMVMILITNASVCFAFQQRSMLIT